MKTIDLIIGLVAAAIGGALLGYILYRFKVIYHRRKVLHDIPKKLDDQEKRELRIGEVKLEKNRTYIIDSKKVSPGKESKLQQKEAEVKQPPEKIKKLAKLKSTPAGKSKPKKARVQTLATPKKIK